MAKINEGSGKLISFEPEEQAYLTYLGFSQRWNFSLAGLLRIAMAVAEPYILNMEQNLFNAREALEKLALETVTPEVSKEQKELIIKQFTIFRDRMAARNALVQDAMDKVLKIDPTASTPAPAHEAAPITIDKVADKTAPKTAAKSKAKVAAPAPTPDPDPVVVPEPAKAPVVDEYDIETLLGI